jgi:hypothetical protein
MRRPAPVLLTVAVAVTFLAAASFLAHGFTGGAPTGRTGAPAVSGADCTSCHDGTTNSGPGSVVISAPSTYAPGSVVPVTVSLTNMQNANKNGFQSAAYNGTTLLSGWTSMGADTNVTGNHVNQTTAGSTSSSWKVYLTTPSTPTTFSIYTAGLDANDGNGSSNDRTYTTSKELTPGTVNLSMTAVPQIGTVIPLALDSPADAGKAYHMAASFGNAGINYGGKTIPLTEDPLYMLTFSNAAPQMFQNYVGYLNGSGKATASLAVPNSSSLIGVTVYHAFLVIDGSQPYHLGTISNGLAVELF